MNIKIGKKSTINWTGEGAMRIAGNVTNLIKTKAGEVPFEREEGIEPDFIDAPGTENIGMLTNDVIENIEAYESRAKVQSVKINSITATGEIEIEVGVEI